MNDDALVKEKTVRALTDRMIAAVNALEFDPSMVGQATDAALSALASAGAANADRAATEAAAAEVLPAAAATLIARDEALAATAQLDRLDAAELIATQLSTETGNITIAVASDSTANDANDWVVIWSRMIAAKHPRLRVEHIGWDDATQAWKTPGIIQAGTGTSDTGGVIMHDKFTRAGDVAGSVSTNGKTWGGNAGAWLANGSAAAAAAYGGITYNCGARDITINAKLALVTTGTGSAQMARFYIGGGVFAAITVGTTGVATIVANKGATTIIPSKNLISEIGTQSNSATPQPVELTFSLAVQNLTLTVKQGAESKTYTAQITEAEYAAQTTIAKVEAATSATRIAVDEITLSTPSVPGSMQTLQIRNGAVAGTTLNYQTTRAAIMWPSSTPVDVVVIAGGHNYTTQDGAAMVVAVESFVGAFRASHPDVRLFVSSENPQLPPSGTVVPHRSRQSAIRMWAKRSGVAYAPVMETFMALPDGGQSLTQSDGIHPTVPSTYDIAEGYGSTLWAHVVDDTITARY